MFCLCDGCAGLVTNALSYAVCAGSQRGGVIRNQVYIFNPHPAFGARIRLVCVGVASDTGHTPFPLVTNPTWFASDTRSICFLVWFVFLLAFRPC